MTDTNRPLWQVMYAARHARPVTNDPMAGQEFGPLYAAEIRAIADWLVPEEEPEPLPLDEQIAWVVRSNLRRQLLAESDRAGAGE